jgi:alanine racemase
MTHPHPTRIVVDRSAIQHNLGLLKQHAGPRVSVMAVVKANAYGHGAVAVAKAAVQAGVLWLGVSSVAEGMELRENGVMARILVMGYTPAALAREAMRHHLSVTLYDLDVAVAFSRAAAECQQPARVHIKIDTGMGRLGLLPDEATAGIDAIASLDGIHLEGLHTHFSCADSDPDYTREQLRRFKQVVAGRDVPWLHACNSAGTMGYPEAHFNLVRPGISLYGLSPYAPAEPRSPLVGQLKPALSFKTRVALVKSLPDGAPVGYGARYHCDGPRRVAVIPVGYGDGFRRTPHNFGEVLVRGQRAPILGSVCMDQCMIDVTHILGVQIEDEVVLIGEQGGGRITADEVAARLGTVNYEVVTALTARPHRIYMHTNEHDSL